MTDNKRFTQTKFLSVKEYLVYKEISNKFGFFSNEMEEFLIEHNLPTSRDLSENNLHVYVDDTVQIHIYNMNEIKEAKVNVHLS